MHAQTTLRYGGDASFAPFESLNAQGQPEGFQIELMQALGRELGVEVSINLQAWPATVEAFKSGRVDVIAMVQTTERRAYAQFIQGHAAPPLRCTCRWASPRRKPCRTCRVRALPCWTTSPCARA